MPTYPQAAISSSPRLSLYVQSCPLSNNACRKAELVLRDDILNGDPSCGLNVMRFTTHEIPSSHATSLAASASESFTPPRSVYSTAKMRHFRLPGPRCVNLGKERISCSATTSAEVPIVPIPRGASSAGLIALEELTPRSRAGPASDRCPDVCRSTDRCPSFVGWLAQRSAASDSSMLDFWAVDESRGNCVRNIFESFASGYRLFTGISWCEIKAVAE